MVVARQIERAFPAQVHVVLQDPLQRQQHAFPRDGDGIVHALRHGAPVDPPYYPLQPPARDVAVDGFGVDTLGPEPPRIHQETRRDLVQQGFQSLSSCKVHSQ